MNEQRFYDIRSTPKDLWELHQEQIAERQLIDLIGIEAYLKRIQDELDSTKKERESNELPF